MAATGSSIPTISIKIKYHPKKTSIHNNNKIIPNPKTIHNKHKTTITTTTPILGYLLKIITTKNQPIFNPKTPINSHPEIINNKITHHPNSKSNNMTLLPLSPVDKVVEESSILIVSPNIKKSAKKSSKIKDQNSMYKNKD